MDRTVLYREIVRIALDGESEQPGPAPVKPDSFTEEMNDIVSNLSRLQVSLKQMRPRYLAMSGSQQMRDSERDDFDYLVRQMLQNEQRRVRALEKREHNRHLASRPHGFASRWLSNPDAESMNDTLHKHRQGMFFYANYLLQQTSFGLAELQQIRSARSTVVKPLTSASTTVPITSDGTSSSQLSSQDTGSVIDDKLSRSRRDGDTLNHNDEASAHALAETSTSAPDDEIPESHMQLLLEEHDTLLEDLNATLAKAQQAEQSLREVADLQAELSQHLSSQSQQLDSLATDVFRVTTDVSGANEQLERAKRSNRRASRIVIVSAVATGVFLLLINGK